MEGGQMGRDRTPASAEAWRGVQGCRGQRERVPGGLLLQHRAPCTPSIAGGPLRTLGRHQI